MKHRCFATDVMTNCVDLIRWHIQLVATLVREQQVIAFNSADRTFDHAFVLGDTMNVMNDVVACFEIFEDCSAFTFFRSRLTMRPATTRDVRFGDDSNLGRWNAETAVQRRHHDGPAFAGEIRNFSINEFMVNIKL